MTTDGDCLLAAIQAKPQDDAPRLIYADWLEEHGQEESAAKIRRWVLDLKPAAIEAWRSRKRAPALAAIAAWQSQRRAPALAASAEALQAVPGEWWRLTAVLGQRLGEVEWPVPYEHITTWPAGWDSDRHRQWVFDTRHKAELLSFGLARPAWSAASLAELTAELTAALSAAVWSAASSAASAAVWSAARSAAWSASASAESAAASAAASAAWSASASAARSAAWSAKSGAWSEMRSAFAKMYAAVLAAVTRDRAAPARAM